MVDKGVGGKSLENRKNFSSPEAKDQNILLFMIAITTLLFTEVIRRRIINSCRNQSIDFFCKLTGVYIMITLEFNELRTLLNTYDGLSLQNKNS